MRLSSRTAGIVVLVASLLALVLSAVNAERGIRFGRCQAQYNEINNIRTRILTDVGSRERVAQRARDDALDAVFLDPSLLLTADQRTPTDAARVRGLFLAYRTAAQRLLIERAAADRARADNPVPPPPSASCGR